MDLQRTSLAAPRSFYERFLSNVSTEVYDPANFEDWSQGRSAYGIWAIEVTDPLVIDRLANLQFSMKPYLLEGYARQPHITIAPCGFASNEASYRDDYTAAHFAAQVRVLRKQAPCPFSVQVGHSKSFTSAPVLEVETHDGVLFDLHDTLQRNASFYAPYEFTPHVTAGFYAGIYSTRDLWALLPHEATFIQVAVSKISLFFYEFQVIGGGLVKVCDFDLLTGAISFCDEPTRLVSQAWIGNAMSRVSHQHPSRSIGFGSPLSMPSAL